MVHQFIARAARECGCTPDQILGPCRKRPIVRARHFAMREAFRAGVSKRRIAQEMNRDRATVIYALREVPEA